MSYYKMSLGAICSGLSAHIRELRRLTKRAEICTQCDIGCNYIGHRKAIITLDLKSLEERRNDLCLNLAQKCVKNPKTKDMFPLNDKIHEMKTRNKEKIKV